MDRRIVVRSATVEDADALLALRAEMFHAIDLDLASHDWQPACRQILLDGLTSRDLIAAVGVTDDGTVVASGIATVRRWLPSPSNPSGLKGYIGSMATREHWRGEGIGRRVAEFLVDALAARGVTEVELHANEAGDGLYRTLVSNEHCS